MKKVNYSIHGLRGLFAIGIMLSHCSFLENYMQSQTAYTVYFDKLANVSFFFIVAGFFLALSQNADTSFLRFMKKKLIRIYPLYLLIILTLVAHNFITGTFELSTFNYVGFILNVLLLQCWGGLSSVTALYTVGWFLSSLLFCYAVGYFLVRLRQADPQKARRITCCVTVVLLLFKIIVAICFPNGNLGYYFCYLFPLAGLADFLIGLMIADIIKSVEFSRKTYFILQIIAVVGLILTFVLKTVLPSNYCRAFLTIPGNVLLVLSFSTETVFSKMAFGNKLFSRIGDISFEIYLLHPLIISLLNKLPPIKYVSSSISPFITVLIHVVVVVLCSGIYKRVYDWFTKLPLLKGR